MLYRRLQRIFQLLSWCAILNTGSSAATERQVSFSRDVLPILSDRCFHCHGPDASHRAADLRLDVRDDAIRPRGDLVVVAPGDARGSELIRRISTDDADVIMPPADSHRTPLTKEEIALLTAWIQQGAVWGQHWAFEPPVRLPLPADSGRPSGASASDSHVNPIDAFVMDRLTREQLQMSPPASLHTLLRRVAWDLTGLPPQSFEQLQQDIRALEAGRADDQTAPVNLDSVLNRLFASPHYGERMAMWWLDAARYADTDGFQTDATRTNWPWRDWVVDAFNQNMPFDQFTIEQFAGDLLPDSTPEQQLATCFHRNHMTNGEGGRDPEESRVDYVIDRTNTMGTLWLGLTLGCCQCHAHKFDPIAHHEYYQLAAFFNSIDEDGRAGSAARPFLKYRSRYATRAVEEAEDLVSQRNEQHQQAVETASSDFIRWLPSQLELVQDGFQPWSPVEPLRLASAEGTVLASDAAGMITASGPNPRQDDYQITFRAAAGPITGLRLDLYPDPAAGNRLSRGQSGLFILTDVKLQLQQPQLSQLRDVEFATAVASQEREAKGRAYGQIRDTLDDDPRNGWMVDEDAATQPQSAVFALSQPLFPEAGETLIFTMLQRSTDGDANIARFRLSVTDQPGSAVRTLQPMPLEKLAEIQPRSVADIPFALKEELLQQFFSTAAGYQHTLRQLQQAEQHLKECQRAAEEVSVMVLQERAAPRPAFVLERGVWDAHGEQVDPGFPAIFEHGPRDAAGAVRHPGQLPPSPAGVSPLTEGTDAHAKRPHDPSSGASLTRLDLARWIVTRDNPLTARVCVNHLWQMLFGFGLVRTPDDFGLQGDRPEFPDLLDWLAVELMEHNWDIQHVLRLMMNSRTYQQSSHVTAELLELDPDNRLLTRQQRFRLPAWMLRDAALSYSQMLNPALGGPPVMPWQPPGVWEEMFMGRFSYQPSPGPARYRRTLYTFWRRSSAPAFLFDSAQRRVCEVNRRQTNTPLQALTLMNDHALLEAAARLATLSQGQDPDPGQQILWMARQVLSRSPRPTELDVLVQHYQQAVETFELQPEQVGMLQSAGFLTATGDGSRSLANAELLDRGRPAGANSGQLAQQAALWTVASMLLNLDETLTRE